MGSHLQADSSHVLTFTPLFASITVRLLREELQLLQEPGSYVGEVVKVMGKDKVLVKVQPEGKYGQLAFLLLLSPFALALFGELSCLGGA
jgi:ATP-dependent 26S proteasome regulatory subunit